MKPIRRLAKYLRNIFILGFKGVKFGKNVSCQTTIRLQMPNGQFVIGNNVGIGHNFTIQVDTIIGNDVMIAAGVSLVARDAHRMDILGSVMMDSPRGDQYKIVIGDDVWIGFGVIILSGVTIGRGSVVAAGAIVTKDVSPYSIVASPAATQIGVRFDSEQIVMHEKLLGIEE